MTTLLVPTLTALLLAMACLVGLLLLKMPQTAGKRGWLYLLVAPLALALLAVGLTYLTTTPAFIVLLEVLALVVGIGHVWLSRKLFAETASSSTVGEGLLAGYVWLAAAGLALVGLLRPDYALGWLVLPTLLPLLLPLLTLLALESWLSVPAKQFKKWFYPTERPMPIIELDNTIRLNFFVTRRPDAPVSDRFTVTLPANRTLDELFQFMIYSNNTEEDPDHPILYHETNSEGTLLGWIFYRQALNGWRKVYIDPYQTLKANGLRSGDKIVARSFTNVSYAP